LKAASKLYTMIYFLYRKLSGFSPPQIFNSFSLYPNLQRYARIFRINDPWAIPSENVLVNFAEKLGSGAFGDVYSGQLVGDAAIKRVYENSPLLTKFRDCKIAIKTLPAYSDEFLRNEFQQVSA
jgi:hypothetical protein